MTKEEAIETIKDICLTTEQLTRIEKALECLLSQPSLPSNIDEAAEEYSERFHDGKDKLYAFHGFRDGAMWRDSQVQRLSNDIDRAAELSANDAMIKRQFPSVVYNTGLKCFDHSDLIKQFKAGAEWMAGQGVKAYCVESSNPVSDSPDKRPHCITLLYDENENTPYILGGDEVEIILRKK